MNAQDIVDAISRRYRGGRERLFIVHGNTGDLYPSGEHLRTLPDYLFEALTGDSEAARKAKIWLHYSVGADPRWINGTDSTGAARVAKVLGTAGEATVAAERPSPTQFFRMVDDACRRKEKLADRSTDGPVIPLRAIVTEAHAIFPDAQMQFLRPEDRALLIQLQRFAHEPAYDATDTLIVLVTDTLSSIHHELRKVAVTLEISRPNAAEAQKALRNAITRQKATVSADPADLMRCFRLAVGLTQRQLECIAAECRVLQQSLTASVLDARRKELIARDYGDLLEFIEPAWTLDNVGGCREAKAALERLAKAMHLGRRIPSGVIATGQNGVGKTFLLTGFAGTVGCTVAVLKPFKASGLGDSERNWDRIATALKSAGQVIVIVQEADAAMGRRTGQNVHEVSKAILAQQLALMGDPAYRGKILWMLDTCRPDILAPDVKRPGRCELMLPIFPPTEAVDVQAILTAQVALLTKREGLQFQDGFIARCAESPLLTQCVGKTGAQLERLLVTASERAADAQAPAIAVEHVLEVLRGTANSGEPEAYELQRLIAITEAIETENADLVPQFYRDQIATLGGIGAVKDRIEVLRQRCDGV